MSRKSPWQSGADLPKQYWHAPDPCVALTMAASVTKTIEVGAGIALLTERAPLLMAKQAASVDFLSAGRLLLGVGRDARPRKWSIMALAMLTVGKYWVSVF